MWPRSRTAQAAAIATIAYVGLWVLYGLFPGFKTALLAAPYLGGAIELFTGLYVAVLIVWAAVQFVLRG
jgi:uncharacterized membrane protein (DUF485 family)